MASLRHRRCNSAGVLQAPPAELVLARLKEARKRTTYSSSFTAAVGSGHEADALAADSRSMRPHSPGVDWRAATRERQIRLYMTTYTREFPSYGADAKPAASTSPHAQGPRKSSPSEERVRMEREAAHWEQIKAAREQEEFIRSGGSGKRTLGYSLTTPPLLPTSEVHACFVSGLPPIYWTTEAKSNFVADVHSRTANDRLQQPTRLVALAKFQFQSG